MRILLADDDEMMRDLLEALLAKLGHQVEAFADGAAVWEAFQALPAPLVLLDWEMPKLDGLEVCRRIRAHPEGADTYLMMITARSAEADLEAVLDVGGDDYLPKPVTPPDVTARLRIAEKRIESGTARRRAEEELRKARYLAGVGEVSLALQHEINNPLAALLTTAALITRGMLRPEEIPESLKTIETQAQRIADVLKRLRNVEPRSVEYVKGHKMVDLGVAKGAPKGK